MLVIDYRLYIHANQNLIEVEKLHSFTMQNKHNFTLQLHTNIIEKNASIYPSEGVEEMSIACYYHLSPIESSELC